MEHPAETPADDLWNAIRTGACRRLLTESASTRGSRRHDPVRAGPSNSSVEVPNEFTRDWIEGHFLDSRARARRSTSGARAPRVSFAVAAPHVSASRGRAPSPSAPAEPGAEPRPAPRELAEVDLNPKYTFDLFVIGSSNRFAHAAALAVAEAPAQAYNPLFIYGGTGLGKTHLLQAIGHYVRQHSRRLTMRYVTARRSWTSSSTPSASVARASKGSSAGTANYDVLLVDDIQFFAGKERIQEEFFHTFNSLYEGGAQIIISSDRPPREIGELERPPPLALRVGLLTDIQAPDLETRIAILRKRVDTEGIEVPDPGCSRSSPAG